MLKGSKIQLRSPQAEDVDRWVVWMNDWDVTSNLCNRSIYGYTREQEEQYFEQLHEVSTDVVFCIETLDGRHIGNAGLHQINREWSHAELGIMIGEAKFRGKGIGTEATSLMVKFAFDYMNLHRVFLHVHEGNPGGIRCYEKAGFKKEGILKEHRYFNGKYEDVIVMGIVRPAR